MGEDQDAAGARGLDEPQRGDRLAGAGRVLEPEALGRRWDPRGARRAGRPRRARRLVLPVPRLLVLAVLVVVAVDSSRSVVLLAGIVSDASSTGSGWRRRRRRRRAVAVALRLGQQRGQRARQRVDLVGREHGAVGEVGLLLGEQPLEPEQQRVLPAPLDRGLVRARVHLRQRSVERAAAGRPGGERVFERLALVDEALAREQLRPRNRGRTGKRGGITHTDRKVACRKCEPRRYCVATQAVSLEAGHGEEVPSEADAPSPPPARRNGSPFKQVASAEGPSGSLGDAPHRGAPCRGVARTRTRVPPARDALGLARSVVEDPRSVSGRGPVPVDAARSEPVSC